MMSRVVLSPSSQRAWIEIAAMLTIKGILASPSSQRAWIEIEKAKFRFLVAIVALLAEGVDRNNLPVWSIV